MLLLLNLQVIAQSKKSDLKVVYDRYTNNSYATTYTMFYNTKFSAFIPNFDQEKVKNATRYSSSNNNYSFFKSFRTESILYTELFLKKAINVKDSLNILDWKLKKGDKEILGYDCKVANATFRGRKYKAYYTQEVPIFDGPWKFNGLPGLILKVTSEDKVIAFKATEVTQEKTPHYLRESFEEYVKEDFMSWNKFKSFFKTKIDQHIKYLKSNLSAEEAQYSNFLKITRPEIIYKELQTGSGIKY